MPARWSSRGWAPRRRLCTPMRAGGAASRPRRRGVRLDDHAARPLGEHRLQRLAEQRRRRCARGSGMTIARARISRASSTIARPACPARTCSTWPVTRRPPWIRACSMIACAASSCSGSSRVDRRRGRHGDRHQHVDAAPAPGGELGRGGDRLRVVVVAVEGDEHRLVLGLVLDDRLRDRDLVVRRQVEPLAAAVDDVDADARAPASRCRRPRRRGAGRSRRRTPGRCRAPPSDREQRQLAAARSRSRPGPAVGPLVVGLA